MRFQGPVGPGTNKIAGIYPKMSDVRGLQLCSNHIKSSNLFFEKLYQINNSVNLHYDPP